MIPRCVCRALAPRVDPHANSVSRAQRHTAAPVRSSGLQRVEAGTSARSSRSPALLPSTQNSGRCTRRGPSPNGKYAPAGSRSSRPSSQRFRAKCFRIVEEARVPLHYPLRHDDRRAGRKIRTRQSWTARWKSAPKYTRADTAAALRSPTASKYGSRPRSPMAGARPPRTSRSSSCSWTSGGGIFAQRGYAGATKASAPSSSCPARNKA